MQDMRNDNCSSNVISFRDARVRHLTQKRIRMGLPAREAYELAELEVMASQRVIRQQTKRRENEARAAEDAALQTGAAPTATSPTGDLQSGDLHPDDRRVRRPARQTATYQSHPPFSGEPDKSSRIRKGNLVYLDLSRLSGSGE